MACGTGYDTVVADDDAGEAIFDPLEEVGEVWFEDVVVIGFMAGGSGDIHVEGGIKMES